MTVSPISDLSDEQFALVTQRAPFSAYQRLRAEGPRTARQLSRLATLHQALGNQREALATAQRVLRAAPSPNPKDDIRSHLICGTVGPVLSLDSAYRTHFFDALAGIADAGLGGSDLHVATMINWACAQATLPGREAALRTFEQAEDLALALPQEWPLRQSRLHRIEVNRALMFLAPAERAAQLSYWGRACERDSAWDLAGHCNLALAEQLKTGNLYTAALHHANKASLFYEAANMPNRTREARLLIANLWFNLALPEHGRRILTEDPRGAEQLGSSWRLLQVQQLVLAGDDAVRMASFEDGLALLTAALDLIKEDMLRAPGLVLHGPLVEIYISAIMACQLGGLPERLPLWLKTLDEFADRLDQTAVPLPIGNMLRALKALLGGDREGSESLLNELLDAGSAGGFPLVNPEALTDLDSVHDVISGTLGKNPSAEADLVEYWEHIDQLVSEDDEGVRAAYRRGNLLPVLHRLLSRQQMDPWAQFEAVELSRWGSLGGALEASRYSPGTPDSLRGLFLRESNEREVVFPASLGPPRGIRWGASHRSSGPEASVEHVDLEHVLAGGGWAEEPQILQLYLRGDHLHRIQFDTRTAAVSRDLVVLDEQTISLLRDATAWISAHPGQIDLELAAAAGLAPEAIPTVAAIRCCLGPFVDRTQLARDFASRLSHAARERLAVHLREVSVPSAAEISGAIGRLVPSTCFGPSDRALALSLSNELTHLPISLARLGARYLGAQRRLTLLPPINTLAAIGPTDNSDEAGAWQLTVVGNTQNDLGYARPSTQLADLSDAFLLPHGVSPARKATLYKGHYFVPSSVSPSRSGLPSSPNGRSLLTAGEILASERRGPARVALMSCRGSGLQFPNEWGGIASALMVKGAREIIAPHWPILDSAEASRLDSLVEVVLVDPRDLESSFHSLLGSLIAAWVDDPATAIPPHWWSGLSLLKV